MPRRTTDQLGTACYARISTCNQSHDSQTRDLKKHVRQYAGDVSWYKEVASGAADERPELERLGRDIAAGKVGRVLIWALDRVSRRGILDGLQRLRAWLQAGVEVHSVREPWVASTADPGMRELLLSVAFWAAEMERNRTRERVRAGLQAAKARGVRLGRRPGTKARWALAKRTVDPQLARSLRSQGASVADIAAKFGSSRGAVYAVLKEE